MVTKKTGSAEPEVEDLDEEVTLSKSTLRELIEEVLGERGDKVNDVGELEDNPDDKDNVVVMSLREIEDMIADRVNKVSKSLVGKSRTAAPKPEPTKTKEREEKPIPQTMLPMRDRIRTFLWGDS